MRRLSSIASLLALTLFLVACPGTPPAQTGTIEFSTDGATVTEGQTVTITVIRTGGSDGAASVDFATSDGSATAGSDYAANAGTLSWADGDSSDKTIEVDTLDDAAAEGDETFTVSLSNPTGAGLGATTDATVTIEDDEGTSAPFVQSASPSDGETDVSLNSNIQVAFSEQMNEAATEAAFSASPDPGCTFSWNASSTVLTCTPSGDLSASTTYDVEIGTGAESAAGVALATAHTFSFTTGTAADTTAPSVVATDPADGETDVLLNANLEIRFSEEMNKTATEAAFSASPSVSCSFLWNAAGDTLTCNPSSNLDANTTYTITIDTGAEDTSGNSLTSDVTFSFTTGTSSLPECVFGTHAFGNCVFGS